MTHPLSMRRHILSIREKENLSIRETAKRFNVGSDSIRRWLKSLEPKTTRNKPCSKIDMVAFKKDVEDRPDDYQYERAERFGVSQRAIFAALKRLGLSRKKTVSHPKAKESERLMFIKKIEQYNRENRPIVYTDESGFVKDALRPYGYSPKGTLCHGVHDWHGKNVVQAIGGLIGTVLIGVGLFMGTVNTAVFTAWLQQVLIPLLPERSVVVMDNASFHKTERVREMIESEGHTILYLPPYSPDLNPIEQKWAEIKAKRKELRTNDIDDLFQCYL